MAQTKGKTTPPMIDLIMKNLEYVDDGEISITIKALSKKTALEIINKYCYAGQSLQKISIEENDTFEKLKIEAFGFEPLKIK